jgi:hypothetical protein
MKVKVENQKGYNMAKLDMTGYTNNVILIIFNHSKLYRKGS